MRNILSILVVILGFVVAYIGWEGLAFLSKAPSTDTTEVIFEVPRGASFLKVAQELFGLNLVTDAKKLTWYARLTGQATEIKLGEYRLNPAMKPREVLAILTSGKSILHDIIVPEGFNIFEIRDALNLKWPGRGDEFFRRVTDRAFIQQLTGQDLSSLEGYLFPDTYQITKFTPVEHLIKKMYARFLETIKLIGDENRLSLPLHQQVILASVIEKETGAPEERPLISSVFHNRLEKKMRLQSDPTIIYGIAVQTGQIKKNITKSDIMQPSAYNTYTIAALPVGPIANPGKESLWAAVNPVASEALYFVSRNDGTHVFSNTLEKHNQAVRDYQLNRAAREGKSWRDLKKKSGPGTKSKKKSTKL